MGGARGKREESPETEKIVVEKRCYLLRLFLVTNISKIIINSIFILNFHQTFSKVSQNFPTICVFRPNTRKITTWFVNF